MMPGDDVLMMPAARPIEVFTGKSRRRRWSAEAKARIVAESYSSSVAEAASRSGVSKTQLFSWRRQARQSCGFARVELTDSVPESPRVGGVIEVQLASSLVRVEPGADAALVGAILLALRSRG
jgi:transposase